MISENCYKLVPLSSLVVKWHKENRKLFHISNTCVVVATKFDRTKGGRVLYMLLVLYFQYTLTSTTCYSWHFNVICEGVCDMRFRLEYAKYANMTSTFYFLHVCVSVNSTDWVYVCAYLDLYLCFIARFIYFRSKLERVVASRSTTATISGQ